MGGSAAVLFTLILLGLLICSLLRRKDGMLGNDIATTRPQTTRHLLDLSEDDRWRYIEDIQTNVMKLIEVERYVFKCQVNFIYLSYSCFNREENRTEKKQ